MIAEPWYNKGEKMHGLNEIQEARKTIRKAMEADPLFRDGYRANIAMLIYDDQKLGRQFGMAGIEGRSTEPPTNLRETEGCNSIADRIIDLVFSV